MKLSDYASGDRFVRDGCHYDSAEDLVSGMLGFCGCGAPDLALDYVGAGLDLVAQRMALWESQDGHAETRFKATEARELEHFGTDGARYFFWYWADGEGFLEHGSLVPGWLTERGKQMLALIGEAQGLRGPR